VLVEGPYGRLTADSRTRQRVLLIGSGVGVTPLRALAEEVAGAPGDDVVLLQRASTDDDALFRRELDRLSASRGLRVVRLVGRRPQDRPSWLPAAWAGRGDVAALRQLVPDVAEREVYVCGPVAWTDLVLAALRSAGVPERHVHLEHFAW
jgi:ferredoxin-NADP reductase